MTLTVAGCALALLLFLYWRAAQAHTRLRDEVERLHVQQRDMTADIRARLEDGAMARDQIEGEMRPRLDVLEPSVADLSATLDENLPTLKESRARLESVETRVAQAEAELRAALEASDQAAGERAERIEQAVRTLRNAADERLADLGARMGRLEGDAGPALGDEPNAGSESPKSDGGDSDDSDLEDGPEIDFAVMEDVQAADEAGVEAADSDEEAALVGAADGDGTSAESRGTPAQSRSGTGGRWVLVLLALVTGLALVLTAL